LGGLAPAGGSLFLGIDDDGRVVGLPLRSAKDLDQYELRLRGIAGSIDPPVSIELAWMALRGLVVAEIQVLPSGEPIHYVKGRPIIRDGSSSRLARPAEVRRVVLDHDRAQPVISVEPGSSSFARDENGVVVQSFAHVRVINVGRTPQRLRAEARFSIEIGPAIRDEPMSLRWSSAPEPLPPIWTPEGIRTIVNVHAIPESRVVEALPGQAEDAAIAICFDDGAWGWTAESYARNFRHPDWQLPRVVLLVVVTVFTGSVPQTQTFRWMLALRPSSSGFARSTRAMLILGQTRPIARCC
jgi:hypothetical protein